MFKGRLIRLFIYLVISIAVIVLLFNIPAQDQAIKKKSGKSDTSLDSSVIEVQLPEKESDPMDVFPIEIDSLGRYIYEYAPISLDELSKEIRVQKVKRPKLFLKIIVHPHSKTEILMNLMEVAREEKLKIGITQN